jgi:hypothetical protein
MAQPVYLTIDLIGRICLIRKGSQRWAVFLKANQDSNFNTRRSHFPALSAPFDRVKQQRIADQAKVTFGALTGSSGNELAESRGVWSLVNQDIRVTGVDTTGPGTLGKLYKLAQLEAIVDSVDHPTKFKKGILAADPRPAGISARFRIPKGAKIQAISESDTERTFIPGNHKQVLADFIRVRIPFSRPAIGPSLRLKAFGAAKRQTYKFTGAAPLKLTMSNLCRCVEQVDLKKPGGVTVEDREFVVFYKLLEKRPPKNKRPLPQVVAISSGVFVPECYRPGEGSI